MKCMYCTNEADSELKGSISEGVCRDCNIKHPPECFVYDNSNPLESIGKLVKELDELLK